MGLGGHLHALAGSGTLCVGGWMGTEAVLSGCENLADTGIRSQDRPAHSG